MSGPVFTEGEKKHEIEVNMKHIIKPACSLFLIAGITTALLGLVHALTLEPIAIQLREAQERTMRAILTEATDFRELPTEPSGSMIRAFEALSGGEVIGYIVELAPVGYAGPINMMVGISTAENAIAGMRVLRHTETPGLGSHITREVFFGRFDNRPLSPIRVVRSAPGPDEIEALTSATITTRAITDAVNEAIEWYNAERLAGRL